MVTDASSLSPDAGVAHGLRVFTTEKARTKMAHAYPNPSAKSGPAERVKTTVQGY
jgi:hypothetical protein